MGRNLFIQGRCGMLRGRWAAIALILAFGLAPGPVEAGQLVGKPSVVDGDTLDFSGQAVDLYGIDAPEVEQNCHADGQSWPCGREARWAAINRISPHWVTCVERGRGADGSMTAVCYLAGVGQYDVAAWLVERGWALADRRVSQDYVTQERAAQAAGAGLWRGRFVPPWDWRQGKRLSP
ncbi:MAG: thermonuclease family protein [Kiloniellales bacterium]